MTIQNVTGMFLLAVALMLRESDAFVNVASAPRCSSRAATTAMSASAGLTRAEAIQRAAAGSGVLAAGVLLGGPVPQARAGEEMMKDEVQQFAELRGQVEKKGRDEVVRGEAFWAWSCGVCRKNCVVLLVVGGIFSSVQAPGRRQQARCSLVCSNTGVFGCAAPGADPSVSAN